MLKNKFTVTLDDQVAEMINDMSDKSGLPAAALIRNMLMLSHTDMYFFSRWFGKLQRGTDQYVRGRHTLMNPGPDTLMSDAKRIEEHNGNTLLIGKEALDIDSKCEGVCVVPSRHGDVVSKRAHKK